MAKKKRDQGAKTAIVVVIHESDGLLYLAPKPGGERAKVGRKLAIVVVNLSNSSRDVAVEFSNPIVRTRQKGGGTRKSRYAFPGVQAHNMAYKSITVGAAVFKGVPRWKTVITVPYTVWVDGIQIDPDLEIER